MDISNLTRKNRLLKLDSSDILPLAFAGLSIGVLVLSVALIWLAISFSKLAHQKPPTLVQQVDGRAFTVRPADAMHREPEVIRQLVHDWAIMTFTWGSVPGDENTKQDRGMEISRNKRVPTSAWEASFTLAPDFREAFLERLAEEVVPEGVFEGKVSAVLVPQNISPPQKMGDGQWQVNLIATRILFDDLHPAGYGISFNRTLYVKAIEPLGEPLIENASQYQRIAHRMLQAGIQIEEIRPLNEEEFIQ